MRILFIDDDFNRHKLFQQKLIGSVLTGTETPKECIKILEESDPFDIVMLDHDLFGQAYVPSGPDTGFEVAEWLSAHPEKMPRLVILHTYNEKGAARMLEVLPAAIYKPGLFAMEYLNIGYLMNLLTESF